MPRRITTWASSSGSGPARPGRGTLSPGDSSPARLCRGAQQPGHHPRLSGQARRGCGALSASGHSQARLRRGTQQLGRPPGRSKTSSTWPWPGSSRRSLASPIISKRSTTSAIILGRQNKHDQAAARFEQAIALQARLRRSPQQPGQRSAGPGPARPGRGPLRASDRSPARSGRGAQQSRRRRLAAGQSRRGRGPLPARHCAQARLCRSPQQPGQRAAEPVPSSTKRRPNSSERSISSRTTPRRKWVWRLAIWSKAITQRGWPAYEARLRIPNFLPQPNVPHLDRPALGRSQSVVARRARLRRYDPFPSLRSAAEGAGARVVLAAQPVLGRLLASYPMLTSCFCWAPASCRNATFICRC